MMTTAAFIVPLGLAEHEVGALFVFVDDLQLGLGVWLAALNVVALALGPQVYNLLLCVGGGGAFLVGGVLARGRERRSGLAASHAG